MLPNFYPQTATLLKSGQVLITGSLKGSFCGTTAMDTVAQLYDPGAGTSAPAGRAANYCFPTAALLPDGRVLIVPGGPENDASFAEIYDPKADFFSVNDWVDPLSRGSTATLLTTGKVLVTLNGPECDGSVDRTALFDSAQGQFTTGAVMALGACMPAAVTLSDGKVLLVGGWFAGPHSQVYHPGLGLFLRTEDMASDRHDHTATLLNDGSVLIVGGFRNIEDPAGVAELYHPPSALLTAALLVLSGDGQEPAAILHASTHQLVSPDDPAVAGEAVEIYCTGLIDGAVIPPRVAIGGRAAEALFFGKAPGYDGLNQINVRVPGGIASGQQVSVRLNYLNRPSNEVNITVQ